ARRPRRVRPAARGRTPSGDAFDAAAAPPAAVASARAPQSRRQRARRRQMVTVVTRVRIRDGREAEWDEVFGDRARAARAQDGFRCVKLCCPEGAPSECVIVGTWETRENWQAWHRDEAFLETRRQLE